MKRMISALVALVASVSLCAQTLEKHPSEDFRIGVAGYSYRNYSIDETLAYLKKMGVHYLSIKDFWLPLTATEQEMKAFKEKCSSYDVEGYILGPIYMHSKAEVDAAFAYAGRYGSTMFIGVPDYELLDYVIAKVAETGIRVAIHTHGPDGAAFPDIRTVVEKVGDPSLGVGCCMDLGHSVRMGYDISEDIIKYSKWIYDIHIKDESAPSKSGWTWEMGRGVIDFVPVVKALKNIGYKGVISLEFEKDGDDPHSGVAESIGYLRGALDAVCQQAGPVKETYTFAVKGEDTLYLDRMYDPAKTGDGLMPAMIYMYGGGFAYGNRGGNFRYLTDMGVQVISIEYRKLLAATGYAPVAPEIMDRAVNAAIDDLTDAIAYTLAHAAEWRIDTSKVMFSGSSAGAISTLMTIYDICNEGPLSKKFPEGFMPAGYIAYAGAIRNHDPELAWKKKPCPMMFFHGSDDATLPIHSRMSKEFSVFGPQYIVGQLKEMGVPYWLYVEDGADHVMSYKPFSGYNTAEIQTFVQKYVIWGLPLQMETHEKNLVSPSSLANPGLRK